MDAFTIFKEICNDIFYEYFKKGWFGGYIVQKEYMAVYSDNIIFFHVGEKFSDKNIGRGRLLHLRGKNFQCLVDRFYERISLESDNSISFDNLVRVFVRCMEKYEVEKGFRWRTYSGGYTKTITKFMKKSEKHHNKHFKTY
jgi:hypothetical protein